MHHRGQARIVVSGESGREADGGRHRQQHAWAGAEMQSMWVARRIPAVQGSARPYQAEALARQERSLWVGRCLNRHRAGPQLVQLQNRAGRQLVQLQNRAGWQLVQHLAGPAPFAE